jgi:hypothetical protein
MATSTTKTNKPFNPRGNDQSPKGYNRAALYSGKALDFDGVNDKVDIPLTINGSFSLVTISSRTGNPSNSSPIVSTQQALDNGISFGFASTGEAQIRINDEVLTGVNVINESLNHIAATWDGSTIKLIVNGIEEASASYSGSLTSTQEITMWNFPHVSAYRDGQSAGLKYFNTALTAAQVADLYNNPEKVVPTGVDNTALKLWLPMMEGAGTTAYDGSGNGNHGTISGATYVNGIGAPVAQSAVMDWNKGSNIFPYSNDYSQSNWNKTNATIVANSGTSPDGSNNASLLYATANGSISYLYDVLTQSSAVYTISAFVKASGRNICWIYIQGGAPYGNAYFDLSDQSVEVSTGSSSTLTATITSVGNDWYKISATTGEAISISSGCGIGISDAKGSLNVTADGTNGILVYGLNISTEAGPYIPTLATPQTTPVLLPQGLTTGRDITGVNLFENVRKQGALNLDGNSWAEVHDNESLDFGTGSFTFEAWAKYSYVSQGSSLNAILSLGGDIGQGGGYGRAGLVSSSSGSSMSFFYNSTGNASTSSFSNGDWVHIVGVYDETNAIIYINGAEERTTARTAASMTNTDVKQIGRDSTAIRYYNDQIAQPRIYNRALTAEEVQRSYDSGKNIYTNS